MNAVLTRLAEERESVVQFIDQTMNAVEAEARDLSDTEVRSLDAQRERLEAIDAQMKPLQAFEARRAAAVDITRLNSRPERMNLAPGVREAEVRSLGQMWTESEQFRSYSGRGTSDMLHIPEFRAVGPDPLLTTTDPGKKLLPAPERYHGPEHFRRFPLLDLVGSVQVSTNVVEYWATSDASLAASPTTPVPEGELKPPVVWDADVTNFTLGTIAGWFKYSRQAAEDIPQLRSLVDQKIRRAIDKKLNELAVAALTSAKSAGNTTTGAAGVSLLDSIRVAMGELEARGVPVGAIGLNPADRAGLDIALLGSTMNGAMLYSGFFGVPVVSIPDLTAGTAVVGDLSEAITWFYRTGLNLYTTDSDISGEGATTKTDFRRNILTTMGELRGVFGVTDASALQFAVFTPKL